MSKITVKNVLKKYYDNLTGKIEYTFNAFDVDFKGFFKLESDPQGENLTLNNFIMRGSILINTEW